VGGWGGEWGGGVGRGSVGEEECRRGGEVVDWGGGKWRGYIYVRWF